MKTRVEKYNSDNDNYIPKRTKKNEQLYEEIKDSELENFSIGMNEKVIGDNSNHMDIDKIKEILEKNYQEIPKRRSINIEKEEDSLEQLELEKTREYDINAILEKAREEKEVDYQEERLKKVRDTQYDILKNLDLDDDNKNKASSKKTKDELLELINTIELNEYQKREKEKQESNKDIDPLDILSDLKGDDGTVVVEAQNFEKEMQTFEMKMNTKEEKLDIPKEGLKVVVEEDEEEKDKLDKSFYTDSMTFDKNDFDSFEDVESSSKIGNFLIKGLIVVVFVAIIGGIILFLNDFLKLGWF